MSVEETIQARLTAQISATTTRIYRNHSAQDAALPYVVWHRITAQRESAMGSDPGNVHATFQFSSFGASPALAKACSDAVRVALQRYRATPIEDIFVIDETELYERDTNKYGHAIDLLVHYRE